MYVLLCHPAGMCDMTRCWLENTFITHRCKWREVHFRETRKCYRCGRFGEREQSLHHSCWTLALLSTIWVMQCHLSPSYSVDQVVARKCWMLGIFCDPGGPVPHVVMVQTSVSGTTVGLRIVSQYLRAFNKICFYLPSSCQTTSWTP